MVHRVTTSDNEWQRVTTSDSEWQRVTASDKKWQRVVQRVTRNENKWPFRLVFLFFQIREEPTTKHPKENSLNFEEDLWRRPIELRAPKKSTQEEILTVRSRNCRSSYSQIFIKISVLKNFAIFRGKDLCRSPFSRKLQVLNPASLKRRLQHRCFPVNIAKFLRTAFFIEQLWWLLLEFRHDFKIYENSMTQTYCNDFFLGRFRPSS